MAMMTGRGKKAALAHGKGAPRPMRGGCDGRPSDQLPGVANFNASASAGDELAEPIA